MNAVTLDGVSPLHEACLGGHAACAKLLVEHGADVRSATIFTVAGAILIDLMLP